MYIVSEELVDKVIVPTKLGEITVLPNHIPIVSELASGDVVAMSNGDDIPFAVVGGFVEVKKGLPIDGGNTEVIILADFAEHVSEINEDAINGAKIKAEELKKQMENKQHIDFEHFESELERSLTRVKIADKWRKRKYK